MLRIPVIAATAFGPCRERKRCAVPQRGRTHACTAAPRAAAGPRDRCNPDGRKRNTDRLLRQLSKCDTCGKTLDATWWPPEPRLAPLEVESYTERDEGRQDAILRLNPEQHVSMVQTGAKQDRVEGY